MTKTKLLIIPTIILSSALLLTGCTSGNGDKVEPQNSASTSSTPTAVADTPQPIPPKYVAPPADMEEQYKAYYFAPVTLNESSWSYYKLIGSTTFAEDSANRPTTVQEWDEVRNDKANTQKFDKMYGEVTSDVEQSAMRVSSYLKDHPNADLNELKGKKDLIINRYDKVGTVAVKQDPKTGLYFVDFSFKDGASSDNQGYGILVPQEGKTPDFK